MTINAYSHNHASDFESTYCSNKRPIQSSPGFDERPLAAVKPYFEEKVILPGELLCNEGDKAEFVAIVMDGKICAMKKAHFGDKKVVVGVFGRGSMVVGSALLSGQVSATSLVATETSNVLILSKKNFEKIAINDSLLGMYLLKFLLNDAHHKLNHAYERIVGFF